MNVFEYDSIHGVISSLYEYRKFIGNSFTYQKLASTLGLQKSYLSKILAKNAAFTQEQTFHICRFANFSSAESEYVQLLAEKERAVSQDYLNQIKSKAATMRSKATQSEDYLRKKTHDIPQESLRDYYLYPETQLVHLALSIERFQLKPELLQKVFHISDDLFSNILKVLMDLSVISRQKDRIQLLKSNFHLPRESSLFHQWRSQILLKSLEHSKSLTDEEKYNFTVTFSGQPADQETIRIEFMKFLKKVEKIVEHSDSKNLYQMSFDLMKWC